MADMIESGHLLFIEGCAETERRQVRTSWSGFMTVLVSDHTTPCANNYRPKAKPGPKPKSATAAKPSSKKVKPAAKAANDDEEDELEDD